MKRSGLIEEVFKMRFDDVYSKFICKLLSCEEAALLLGVSVKTFYRKRQIYEAPDFSGRFDRRLGRPSPNRAGDKEVESITQLYASRYHNFTVKHFYSFAQRQHGLNRSYAWTKNTLQNAYLVRKSTKGGKHRKRRERRPMEGMMLHQDGSTHRWIPALNHNLDLIVTMDDATSKITSAFIVEQEGTLSTFQGLKETIENYGLFCSLYTDRGSHYFYTPKANAKVSKEDLTQVGRALSQLRIQHIAAYSPEARGRSERAFRTIQDRLPKELNMFNISTMLEANKYLKNHFIPAFNEEFSEPALVADKAYVAWIGQTLDHILCIQESRVVQQDNTVRFDGLILQIPNNDYRHHYVKATVTVHRHTDQAISIFYGHLCIGKYDGFGKLFEDKYPIKQAI